MYKREFKHVITQKSRTNAKKLVKSILKHVITRLKVEVTQKISL